MPALTVVQVLPPSVDFEMPPSLPAYTIVGSLDAKAMVCRSGCTWLSDHVELLQLLPAENAKLGDVVAFWTRQTEQSAPPKRAVSGVVGDTPSARS